MNFHVKSQGLFLPQGFVDPRAILFNKNNKVVNFGELLINATLKYCSTLWLLGVF